MVVAKAVFVVREHCRSRRLQQRGAPPSSHQQSPDAPLPPRDSGGWRVVGVASRHHLHHVPAHNRKAATATAAWDSRPSPRLPWHDGRIASVGLLSRDLDCHYHHNDHGKLRVVRGRRRSCLVRRTAAKSWDFDDAGRQQSDPTRRQR